MNACIHSFVHLFIHKIDLDTSAHVDVGFITPVTLCGQSEQLIPFMFLLKSNWPSTLTGRNVRLSNLLISSCS